MLLAQKLYESGKITYMRTDSVNLSQTAIDAASAEIRSAYGEKYHQPRVYKTKSAGAQEAHEAIRPAGEVFKTPAELSTLLHGRAYDLYELIWKRTIASQMSVARLERTAVDVGSADGEVMLRANGQVVLFDGFLAVYDEGRDDDGEDEGKLPVIMQGEPAAKRQVTPDQHFTQAPPRYTEATLVKRMEELGIGRPSTYASIIGTIQDREYVRKDKNRLIPEDKGRLVTAFLTNFFRRYVEYDFTADLESQLDDVSAGERDYKEVLSRFWRDFSAAIAETADGCAEVRGAFLVALDIVETEHHVSGFAVFVRYQQRLQGGAVGDDGRLHAVAVAQDVLLDGRAVIGLAEGFVFGAEAGRVGGKGGDHQGQSEAGEQVTGLKHG